MPNTLDHWYTDKRPLIIGHRGASAYAPMNTLPAFELAAAQGADGIELDVWLCKSGEVVVLHDATVNATTDGTGTVWSLTLDELKALDAGSWKDEGFAGTRIPTLDEVFSAVGRYLYINVEIKSHPDMLPGIETAVAAAVSRHGLEERVLISSFDPAVLIRFAQAAPGAALAFLEHPQTPPQAYITVDTALTYQARHPHHSMVDAAYMERAGASDKRVHVWTVNDPEDALRLRDLGIDAVITDAPDLLIAALS